MTDVSQYLLLDRIAVGGMAEIYRAKSLGVEGFEKIVVLKRILPQLADDDEFVAMFVSEAKIAVQLNHANIVPIYELGKIGKTHFIAMEYVWGKDLVQILARFERIGQPMPPPMAAWIAAKTCEALDYAHRKRDAEGRPLAIIHRDVSPQNVLVSYDGLVKLIDFGIAKAAGRATQTQAGVIKGKLAYMSPEQVMGRPMDHRSDVFAASSLLHELLTGKRLFAGTSDIDVIDKVRDARAAPPSGTAPHVPAALDAVVMRGLARDPAERFQTALEMHDQLMHYIASMRPPYRTTDLSKWMRVAFAPEISSERAHLERLTQVERAGVPVAPAEPALEHVAEEVSRIVSVEEISMEVSMPSMPAQPASARAPAWAAPMSPPAASEVQSVAALRLAAIGAQQPVLTPPPEHAIAAATAGHAAYAPHVPAPAQDEALVPDAPYSPAPPAPGHHEPHPYAAQASLEPAPAPRSPPAPAFTPPRVSASSLATPSAPTTPRKKRSRWPIVLVLLLLLAGAAGGVTAWLFYFGGRAVLGV